MEERKKISNTISENKELIITANLQIHKIKNGKEIYLAISFPIAIVLYSLLMENKIILISALIVLALFSMTIVWATNNLIYKNETTINRCQEILEKLENSIKQS